MLSDDADQKPVQARAQASARAAAPASAPACAWVGDRAFDEAQARPRAQIGDRAQDQIAARSGDRAQVRSRAAAGIPEVDAWPDLTAAEREYRSQVLDDIARRVVAEGVRHAAPSPDRGRQFLPFAALKE